MEVLVLGFPTKDIPEDSCTNKDSQKEHNKHRAVYQGQYTLRMGKWTGPGVATVLRLQGSILFM